MKKSIRLGVAILLATVGTGAMAQAPLLADLFRDHAVIQRDKSVPVWGEAAPGASISVRFAGTGVSARADKDGHWQAMLPAHTAGGPFTMTVSASDGRTQSAADMLIGDVWLCSGQSNMEFPLRDASAFDIDVQQATVPDIRLLKIARTSRGTPQSHLEGAPAWQPATPASAAGFSAVCWYMARNLHARDKVPIGLIDASWGGSIVEDWESRASLTALGGYTNGLKLLAQHERNPAGAEAGWQAAYAEWQRNKLSEAEAAPDFDDHSWPTNFAADFWESWGDPILATFDGVLWFRQTVTLSAEQVARPATINIGPVDDFDTTFINGKSVGNGTGWNTPRIYSVPAGLLKPGGNLIAVRVVDTGGGGGLHGDPAIRAIHFEGGPNVSLAGAWRYRAAVPFGKIGPPPRVPWEGGSGYTTLFNGMIAPLAPYALRGIAWYQGEANANNAGAYAKLLPAMIADWRKRFDVKPFLIVQLAGYGPAASKPGASDWASLREVQRTIAVADPAVGLASAIDLGSRFDIHPASKPQVGQRLALAAEAIADGRGSRTGPTPASVNWVDGTVTIRWAGVQGSLVVNGAAGPIGFELCDAGGACRFANAEAEGDSVRIAAPERPARIRYLWADSPVVNLFSGDGRPALPFDLPVKESDHE